MHTLGWTRRSLRGGVAVNLAVHARFCGAVATERRSQEQKHGVDCFDIPDSTDNPEARLTWETIARNSCDRAFREGRLTMAHVLDEECAEALTAAARGDTQALKGELIQTAAVCLAWLEEIEKREAAAIATKFLRGSE